MFLFLKKFQFKKNSIKIILYHLSHFTIFNHFQDKKYECMSFYVSSAEAQTQVYFSGNEIENINHFMDRMYAAFYSNPNKQLHSTTMKLHSCYHCVLSYDNKPDWVWVPLVSSGCDIEIKINIGAKKFHISHKRYQFVCHDTQSNMESRHQYSLLVNRIIWIQVSCMF